MTDPSASSPVERAIREHLEDLPETTDPPSTLLIAWSGGADSTALLLGARAVLREHHPRTNLVALHVNHQLRPAADRDARWCRQLAARLDISLTTETLDISAGDNLQARARTQRYAALRIAARRLEADAVWTGHHAADALETALLNWMRGAGADGLTSLLADNDRSTPTAAWQHPSRPRIERPLLSVEPEACRSYLRAHDLEWREDASNRDTRHRRNLIRHEVLPTLRETGGSTDTMTRTLQNIRSDADALTRRADTRLQAARHPTPDPESTALATSALADAHPAVAARMLMQLARSLPSPVGWNRQTLEAIHRAAIESVDHPSRTHERFSLRGAVAIVDAPRTIVALERDRGFRSIDARRARPIPISLDVDRQLPLELPWFSGHIRINILNPEAIDRPASPEGVARLDRSSLPDRLRLAGPLCPGCGSANQHDGDGNAATSMRPIGFDGHKSIRDMLREADVPRHDRWRHPCLYGDDRLLWVARARQAHDTRIDDETDTIVEIRTSPSHPFVGR